MNHSAGRQLIKQLFIVALAAAGFLWCLLSGLPTGLASPAPVLKQAPKIPVGTVLPVSLEHSLDSKDVQPGDVIAGRIRQEAPLLAMDKIPSGAKITGTVLRVTPAGERGATITFKMSTLEFHHYSIPVVTGLRAAAPFEAVQGAQISAEASDTGSPSDWATTIQIGGDIRYGNGGKVMNRHKVKVGKGTKDGVLARLDDLPGSPCAGWPGNPVPDQALWVFSASACGVYELKGVQISHAGNTEPLGEITLTRSKGDIKLVQSSGLLLRVVH